MCPSIGSPEKNGKMVFLDKFFRLCYSYSIDLREEEL